MTGRRGFTLIELLLVIGIIAILAAIVIVAVNPTKSIGEERNKQRRSDVNTILKAVYSYAIDNSSELPPGIVTSVKGICRTGATSCRNGINLDILTGSYIIRIPMDPQASTSGTGTDYTIVRDAKGRITVAAPDAEQGATISVTQ